MRNDLVKLKGIVIILLLCLTIHNENLFNTMKMFEFMKEKGVFDEFYERIKKEVFGDE